MLREVVVTLEPTRTISYHIKTHRCENGQLIDKNRNTNVQPILQTQLYYSRGQISKNNDKSKPSKHKTTNYNANKHWNNWIKFMSYFETQGNKLSKEDKYLVLENGNVN